MKTRLLTLLVFWVNLMVMLPGYALSWEKEPTTFMDIPFGASLEEAKKILPSLDCFGYESGRERKDFPCRIEDIKVATYRSGALLGFKSNKLKSVHLIFPPKYFDDVKNEFIKRYGEPTSKVEKLMITQKDNNEILNWLGENIKLELVKYSIKSTINYETASTIYYAVIKD